MPADVVTLATGLAPAAPVMRVLAQFNRHQIETFAEVAIALLDLADGDPDAETEALEDDFTPMPADIDFGPGCPIADPGAQCTEDETSSYHPGHDGPGCPLSDPGEEEVAL